MHLTYMARCLQLAQLGEGQTMPNPMVGAVIVHNDRIIGEGFHRCYGEPHAEVNAIRSVKNPNLLPDSTLYVSLEPCSHFGKTPPCSQLIIEKGIRRVVIATQDPNPKVAGNGIRQLKEAGVETLMGVLEKEAQAQNRVFFVNQMEKRPYVILKWAQSADGFMDTFREANDLLPATSISNCVTQTEVHKLRTRVQGILVGTQTALLDNPQLNARYWYGNHPTRIVIDREATLPSSLRLFDGSHRTLIFTSRNSLKRGENTEVYTIDFESDTIPKILDTLYQQGIYSLMVEGGAKTLQKFIASDRWDEAFVETGNLLIHKGVKAPVIEGESINAKKYLDSQQIHLKNKISRNFL